MISVNEGQFILEILNAGSVPTDTYVLVMSTNAVPGALPVGYQLAGKTYNVRPSGSLTESEKLMALNLSFQEPLPADRDPHTLAIVGWDAFNKTWDILGGDLLYDQRLLTLDIRRFRIYALATTPTWRDSFQEFSLTGLSDRNNTRWGPGQTIVLNSAAISGTATSIPITPTNATGWGRLHFSATTSLTTGLTVDILDLQDNVVAAKVGDGVDLGQLSQLTLTAYPSLKLRATLTSTVAGETPALHAWSLGWTLAERKLYLPLISKEGPTGEDD